MAAQNSLTTAIRNLLKVETLYDVLSMLGIVIAVVTLYILTRNLTLIKNDNITRICAAEMAVRYAALCACRKVHT